MKVLLLGSGGREHALAWKIAQSPKIEKLYIAPGNAGTSAVGENVAIKATDFPALKAFALEHKIDMIVVGPEDPVGQGIFDFFKEDAATQHIAVIGLHIRIRRIILRRRHELVSTAKAFCLQLFRSFRHTVAFRYGKAHLFDASLDHNIDNLLIAHAAVDLVGTCLQLSCQSLPARLHFKGSGIFYQLFFMQQLGDIRRSHAVLDNNKA